MPRAAICFRQMPRVGNEQGRRLEDEMANTKALARDERKKAKRKSRKELTKLHRRMTDGDHTARRKAEKPIGIRKYLEEKAKKAAEG